MSEEQKELTDIQRMAKEALDIEIKMKKEALKAELRVLEGIDTEKIARRIGEKPPQE